MTFRAAPIRVPLPVSLLTLLGLTHSFNMVYTSSLHHNVDDAFNDTDADITLRSADGIEFHLYRVILAKASPVFRDMFSASQLQDARSARRTSQSHAVVTVSEDSQVLHDLFRLCYPVDRPVFRSLDDLSAVLTAATKYQMWTVEFQLQRELETNFLHVSPPLHVYAVACHHQLPDLARAAAKLLLEDPHYLSPGTIPRQCRTLSYELMLVFTTYRTECLQAALAVVADDDWLLTGAHPYQLRYTAKGTPDLSSTWVWLACNSCTKARGIAATCLEPARRVTTVTVYPRTWWTRYVAHVRDVLGRWPTAGVVVQPPVVDPCLDEAALCRTCAPKARRHLTEFSHMLLERIEQATNQLPF
ncbi:hypothetical protein C8Q74DRAFT_692431 [Fomes fomentarius]|nr:hypothetical protein C8Q74DRAFT_692431 [Fomes fomentarius]